MDFTYSEEQQMLVDSLRRFVETEYTFEKRRRRSREAASFDPQIWSLLADMGVIGLTVPEEYGGFGEGAASRLVVQFELGRALTLEPVIPSGVVAAQVLNAFGSPAQKDNWLPAIASGTRIVTAAWLEPGTRYRPEAVRTGAHGTQDGYVLNGVKSLVWHGETADAMLVTARLDGGNDIGLFIVPRSTPGLTVTAYPTMDGLRAADLKLESVVVGEDAMIGGPKDGLKALTHGLDHGIAALCADAAGAMEKLIEITVEYLRNRRQFGQPLGAFQALQHRMADMLVQKELALSMAYVAAQALDEADPAQRRRMLSAAKVSVAKAGRFVGQQAVQLHGGMGMTDELEVGDYLKRLTMFDSLLGDSDYHVARYCDAMQS
ncbi:acyl-CoA dehydrogenase family protein [Paraburkholderia saeva]|uniref:L-prolyl-[peptidyl-carrier protein] dehydrogenase n=1 Tax=Paraburkholderia saeva TaxID=2777537 RepID=A0A9N8WZ52_9BURK|nr:acyl-CoA dehydrogenase [Paraburkholderia saeva]CAG4886749.1 L-prolyl-[peptidyl-carrier protein] dehydrogenase [Paraburkholderia saeva]CAG4887210.1 L-prolyl-[peptidyl-carrier protein] dehydrogenase [Paraburkholderia saeva]